MVTILEVSSVEQQVATPERFKMASTKMRESSKRLLLVSMKLIVFYWCIMFFNIIYSI